MSQVDWVKLATTVAVEVLGEPKLKTKTHWRWGNKGSLALAISGDGEGTFYDFENQEGYSCIDFIKKNGKDVKSVLQANGYTTSYDLGGVIKDVSRLTTPSVKYPPRSYSRHQMQSLSEEALIKVQYSSDFWVMRFSENHAIKQKYAPFTKQEDGSWIMARPEAPLPIYLSEREPEGSVLLVEGEKAMRGAEDLYQGQVCCHHGGVNNWHEGKTDWSNIYGRKILIWPDNDEAGKKFAVELKAYLNSKKCSVEIIKIPKDFKEKDDLYDAYENNYFKNQQDFNEYLINNLDKSPRGSFELISIKDMESNIKPPQWLIDQLLERETVGSIFGAAKSGKSLISLSMMLSIASGKDWFEFVTKQTPVILFCGEGERSIHKRILAWSKFNEIDIKDSPFRMSNRPARILDDQDFDLIMQTLKNTYNDLGDIGCVCIDTLQRNWGGGDENSSSDMGKFIQRVDQIKYEFNCNVTLVHHSGHVGGANRSRGSSVLPSSVDFEFKVDRKDSNDDDIKMFTSLKQTLNKEGMDLPAINFEVIPIANLQNYPSQTSATIDKVDFIPKEDRVPDNLVAINNAITIVHSEKIANDIGVYEATVSIEDIVKYLDDPKKNKSWVSKQLNRYKDHKSHCWIKTDRGQYQCESLLKTPF